MKDLSKGGFLRHFDWALLKMKQAASGFISILMLGMGIVMAANIVLRYFFESPIHWSNSISRYAYIYIVLIGTAVSYIEGSHAKIDAFYEAMPHPVKKYMDAIHYLCLIFVCVMLFYAGLRHVGTTWYVKSPFLTGFPMAAVYLSIPICAGVILIFLIRKMVGLCRGEDMEAGSRTGHFLS